MTEVYLRSCDFKCFKFVFREAQNACHPDEWMFECKFCLLSKYFNIV